MPLALASLVGWQLRVDSDSPRLLGSLHCYTGTVRPVNPQNERLVRLGCPSTLDGHKTISCIPADPFPIGVCDDAATAYFIRRRASRVVVPLKSGRVQAPGRRIPDPRLAVPVMTEV